MRNRSSHETFLSQRFCAEPKSAADPEVKAGGSKTPGAGQTKGPKPKGFKPGGPSLEGPNGGGEGGQPAGTPMQLREGTKFFMGDQGAQAPNAPCIRSRSGTCSEVLNLFFG